MVYEKIRPKTFGEKTMKYKEFIEDCLEKNNMEGICSLKEFNQMTKQSKTTFWGELLK